MRWRSGRRSGSTAKHVLDRADRQPDFRSQTETNIATTRMTITSGQLKSDIYLSAPTSFLIHSLKPSGSVSARQFMLLCMFPVKWFPEASVRWYYRKLADGLVITHARPEFAVQLEELQRTCFPTLAEEERFKSYHYLKHMELFDDGQFVALDGDRVVGATTTLRLDFDFDHVDHTFGEIIQGGWLTSHQPNGAWLYGADISVHPEYRGRGIATALYAARQEVVWRLGLKGQVTAGMIPGYGAVKDQDDGRGILRRRPFGPSCATPRFRMQMNAGFEPRGLLANYLNDPVCDNYSVLLVLEPTKSVRGASDREQCHVLYSIEHRDSRAQSEAVSGAARRRGSFRTWPRHRRGGGTRGGLAGI